ncbi:hypothetical protein [Pengzhenrongella sp.]|uniref:hypothetical protein n=1 Tax=Pengzhenrongella sp. TaxID=2888820 RepID=UPI002F93C4AB
MEAVRPPDVGRRDDLVRVVTGQNHHARVVREQSAHRAASNLSQVRVEAVEHQKGWIVQYRSGQQQSRPLGNGQGLIAVHQHGVGAKGKVGNSIRKVDLPEQAVDLLRTGVRRAIPNGSGHASSDQHHPLCGMAASSGIVVPSLSARYAAKTEPRT